MSKTTEPEPKPCLHTAGCRGIMNCSCKNCTEWQRIHMLQKVHEGSDPVELARRVSSGLYDAVAEEVSQITAERLTIEPDEEVSPIHDVWRLVTADARKRRQQQQCSARPAYEATVYTLTYAKVLSRAPAIIPDLIRTAETLARAVLQMADEAESERAEVEWLRGALARVIAEARAALGKENER
jgi:hypothetical protein